MAKSNLDLALLLIAKKGSARTETIAQYLGIEPAAVAALLQPAVDSGYLLACAILRPGKPDAVEYRVSLAADLGNPLAAPAFRITASPRAEAARSVFRHTPPPRLENRDFKVATTATPAKSELENSMSHEKITRQIVLAHIVGAGAAGITRKALIEFFGGSAGSIDQHLLVLSSQQPPAIFRPEKGRVVASQFNGQEPPRKVVMTAAGKTMHATRQAVLDWLEKQPEGQGAMPCAIAQGIGCDEDSTRAVLAGLYAGMKINRQKIGDDWAYFVGEPKMETQYEAPAEEQDKPSDADGLGDQESIQMPAEAFEQTPIPSPARLLGSLDNAIPESYPRTEFVLPGGELAVPSRDDIERLAGHLGMPLPAIVPAVVEDIILDEPSDVEFAIFSSGGLDIYCAETTVTLNKAVLGKLRAFLGLFQEAA